MKPNLRFEVQVVIGQARDGKGVLGGGSHLSKGQESQENEACLELAHYIVDGANNEEGSGFCKMCQMYLIKQCMNTFLKSEV